MSLINELVELDRNLFSLLNGNFTTWLDQPMYFISSDLIWVPLYLFFIFIIIKKYRKTAWLPILFLFLGVGLSDQISNRIKKAVGRPRPTHDEILSSHVHTVNNYRGGPFGFVSSHAANTFCIATMLSLLLYLEQLTSWLLFLWAALVSYSRIYLGVHFPLDILAGALLGIVIGFFLFYIEKKCLKKLQKHTQALTN